MAISLFPHNAEAYEEVISMFRDGNKACVIHPTGTGKSFIGFKLCEDHPDSRICWISPSEYIFKTQLENLTATGADVPENITFLTYSKLMLMDEDELKALAPDYLVVDELHRGGAAEWGKSLKRLFSLYPDVKRLGLSATNIRYLDNQRDMAAELFDSNIASEMTLGEAMVRGILNVPTYILSVYAFEKDLKKYKARIRKAKSAVVRDEAERQLEAMRRTLEKADGLDELFAKHMPDRHGKYIAFCSNAEHMREMVGCADTWFHKVDESPHIYSVYSQDPTASESFQEFKLDGSEHLRVLYAINALNEGVHVNDIDGVILLRPTVSPIIYKQQIGRALSASSSKTPVIFDIVNNIESLYSIGTIEQEMMVAVNYYRSLGESQYIVNERFTILEELQDAKLLLEKLNDTLTASWNLMYEYAAQYAHEHGNLEVPRRYKTKDGYSLGNWIFTQRKVYSGEQFGILGEERIRKLDSIGMVWDSMRELSWHRYYSEAQKYFSNHGDLNTNVNDVTESGIHLGQWICRLRGYRKSGIQRGYLTQERIEALDKLGMIWDVPDYLWEKNYAACQEYYQTNGNLDIPDRYCSPDGLRIGTWIRKLRKLRQGKNVGAAITAEQIKRLDSIGMVWDNKHDRSWQRGINEARRYFKENGNLDVPATYASPSGFRLGSWIANQRVKGKEKQSAKRQKLLDEMGMIWQKSDSWEVRYELVKKYYKEHGSLNMPGNYQSDGVWLAKWLNEQRQIYIGNRPGRSLSEDQIQRLEAIGMNWGNRTHQARDKAWNEQYAEARRFYEEHSDLKVPVEYRTESGRRLGTWILRQRKYRKENKLSNEQIRLLDAIGMEWELNDSWEIGFAHAKQYFEDNKALSVPTSYVCADGYRLGGWISNQRNNHNNPAGYHRLTDEQAHRLEAIGMIWNLSEKRWREAYQHAKNYMEILGGKCWTTNYISPDGYRTGSWMRSQVRTYERGGVSEDHRRLLTGIGLLAGTVGISGYN